MKATCKKGHALVETRDALQRPRLRCPRCQGICRRVPLPHARAYATAHPPIAIPRRPVVYQFLARPATGPAPVAAPAPTPKRSPNASPKGSPSPAPTVAAPRASECVTCRAPLVYRGRGRPPKYCADHEPYSTRANRKARHRRAARELAAEVR